MFLAHSYDLKRSACCVLLAACAFACGADESQNATPWPGTGATGGTVDSGPAIDTGIPGTGGSSGFPTGGVGGYTQPPRRDSGPTPCKVQATVIFVIDGSGSMCAPFGASTRWQQLRSALLDPQNGLIYQLQGFGEFGMLLYDGTIDMLLAMGALGGPPCAFGYAAQKAEGECPQLIEVPPALNNAVAIDQAFPPTELGGSTPTDKAMEHAVNMMLLVQSTGLDLETHPQYIILATDGQPNDICVGGAGGDGVAQQQGVIAAVDKGAASGITTFVISLAGGDAALEAHLDEVARHGRPADPSAHTFTPASPEELVTTLREMLNAALGCVE